MSNVGKLAEGQAYIDQCLDTFTAEQRFHGERLAHIETKMNQILEKVGGGIDDIRNSMTSAVQSFENAKDTSVRWSAVSKVEHIFGQFEGPKRIPWGAKSTQSLATVMEEDDHHAANGGADSTLAADWPSCVAPRSFGTEGPRTSNLSKLPTLNLVDQFNKNTSSLVPQEGKAFIDTRFAHCVLEPSSSKRIAFDMVAIGFLMYDLCVTPVAIAWDFPMSGWLLYCTTVVALFWTVDMVVTARTGFYQAGVLVLSPSAILRKYLRTTLFPDLLIVLIDWLTVFANVIFPEEEANQNPEMIGAKLVRFSKVTRAIRIISVTRVIRIQEYLEHIGDRLHGGTSLKYVGEMGRLVLIIIWINHVMSCTWFYVGRVTEGDTGTSWLNDPIRDENSPLYHDTLPLFQYTTAFHWALTQMTPGSMQVFPRNSLERLFNIFALVFGMIFFSSLISSLSATMVNFRMKSTQTANQMAELRRFLRQANISSKLAIGVQKEALERLMEVKPLMVIDVKALKLLSADLQKELQYELCLPFLMRSGFYRVCHAADTGALKSIMIGCMAFTVYNAGEAVFEAGEEASAAFIVERGALEYSQNKKTSKVKKKHRVTTHNEVIIAEPAIWTHWQHVGTLVSPNTTSLLKINVEKHEKIIRQQEIMSDFAGEFAMQYRIRLAGASPPKANWPSDIEVPHTTFDEVIVNSSRETRRLVSNLALEVLKDQASSAWGRTFGNPPKNIEELEREVAKNKCTLITTHNGDVERLAAVSAIEIRRQNGMVLMQLGSWDASEGLKVGCKLPGTKQEVGENAADAMLRYLRKDLLPFMDLVDLQEATATVETEWSRSEKYSLRTRYLRTVFQVTVRDPDYDDVQLLRLQSDGPLDRARPAGPPASRRSGFRARTKQLDDDGAEECIADTHELIGLPDGDHERLLICGWLHDEEADRFKGGSEGLDLLHRRLVKIHADELVISSVKELCHRCSGPPAGDTGDAAPSGACVFDEEQAAVLEVENCSRVSSRSRKMTDATDDFVSLHAFEGSQ